MLPERFLIAGVEQACRGPPRLTRCKSHKKRRLACGSSAHKRRHENWVDAGQNTRLKTSTISRELSFLLISRMSRFIPQDRLGAFTGVCAQQNAVCRSCLVERDLHFVWSFQAVGTYSNDGIHRVGGPSVPGPGALRRLKRRQRRHTRKMRRESPHKEQQEPRRQIPLD